MNRFGGALFLQGHCYIKCCDDWGSSSLLARGYFSIKTETFFFLSRVNVGKIASDSFQSLVSPQQRRAASVSKAAGVGA